MSLNFFFFFSSRGFICDLLIAYRTSTTSPNRHLFSIVTYGRLNQYSKKGSPVFRRCVAGNEEADR